MYCFTKEGNGFWFKLSGVLKNRAFAKSRGILLYCLVIPPVKTREYKEPVRLKFAGYACPLLCKNRLSLKFGAGSYFQKSVKNVYFYGNKVY